MNLSMKHLLGLRGVDAQDIIAILDTARSFREILERPIKSVPTLRGKTIVNLFYESSTRTRISFELAEKRLSGNVVNFSKESSSVSKGESLRDTLRNIEAMKIDMVVVRHHSPGVPLFLTRNSDATIINAGDGQHEHPTQALLDMMTIREKRGRIQGQRVAIVGDILHSRVAPSNIWGLKTMGASVILCGPSTLLPHDASEFGVESTTDLKTALDGADVVMLLRLQLERQTAGLLPSLTEYRQRWGVNGERLSLCRSDVTIMHPGPINRGIELSSDVADGKHSVILEQVTNGVAVRMAVLYLLSGGHGEEGGQDAE
jgi:aspartate carbamoyltransferase catalytic subunit